MSDHFGGGINHAASNYGEDDGAVLKNILKMVAEEIEGFRALGAL